METMEVREALRTAIMLGEVAQTCHTVEINGIGQVQINEGQAALKSQEGKWLLINQDNLENFLEELMGEPMERKVKRQIKFPVFS